MPLWESIKTENAIFFGHMFPDAIAKASVTRGAEVQKSAHACTKTCPGVRVYAHTDKTVGAPDGSVLKLTAAEVTRTLKGLIV